jgi:23S rRNA pseudouridine2605 synthase
LIRMSFGPFQLNDLPEGAVEEVRTAILKDQLGEALAKEAEVEFDAPVFVYEDEDFHPRKRETSYRETIPGKPDRKARFAERDGEPNTRGQEAGEEEKPRPKRRAPTEPLRSVWRAGEDETGEAGKQRSHKPRRGDSPQEARQESAARPHQRAGRIKTTKGGDVLVEKVVREKTEDLPVRSPRKARPARDEAPQREFSDRPRAPRDGGERPPRREFSDRPRAPREGGERPPRREFSDRPRAPREGGERPPRREFSDRPRAPREGGERPPRREFSDRPRQSRDGAPKSGAGPRRGPPKGGAGGGGKPRPPRNRG